MERGEFDWRWDEQTIFSLNGEDEPFSEDKLDRRMYAEYLYFYLENKGRTNNTVINLNAEWGAGKSFFIKRFYNSIKNVHPCVYIDAWKQDFSDDAFLTLFSSLSQQLQKYAGDLDTRLIECGQAIGRFTKGVVPVILSGLMKKYTGVDSVGDIAKEASQLMLQEHQEKLKSIISLKKELALWSRLAFEKGYSSPIFIFIDELDRCRPDYAISLLEIVKHIFDIPNFVFIIATDTDQLQHSIKNIYGNDFSANDYLGRFFHRRFTLKSPEMDVLINGIIQNRLGDRYSELSVQLYPITSTAKNFSTNISAIFEAFELNLRDSIRNTERLIDLMQSDLLKKKLDYIFLLTLMVIYDKDRSIIEALIGRSRGDNKLSDLIKGSQNLKGVSKSLINLVLETRQQALGINYIYRTASSRMLISEIEPELDITFISYLTRAIYFITNIQELKIDIQRTGLNSLMSYSQGPLNSEDAINYLNGVLLEKDHHLQLYSLHNYIEFIELATSFE